MYLISKATYETTKSNCMAEVILECKFVYFPYNYLNQKKSASKMQGITKDFAFHQD